jgi:polyvinyl alcohol dehydrogenase (cytochrome)
LRALPDLPGNGSLERPSNRQALRPAGIDRRAVVSILAILVAAALAASLPAARPGAHDPPPLLSAGAIPTPSDERGGAIAALASANDWPTYLHDPFRTASNPAETGLSASNAGKLVQEWNYATGGIVAASPSVADGKVFVGSWDGHEYAFNETSGARVWESPFLGITGSTQQPRCVGIYPAPLGITSSATVANGFVYVGGGNGNWYALHETSGTVAWSVFVGSPSKGYYNWASPLIYNGSAYIGIASDCDRPLVRSGLLQVSLATHRVTHAFYDAGPTQVGGAIWSSPAVDPATNTIFVTTGDPGNSTTPTPIRSWR